MLRSSKRGFFKRGGGQKRVLQGGKDLERKGRAGGSRLGQRREEWDA